MVAVRWSWTVKVSAAVLPIMLGCLLFATPEATAAATLFPGMNYCNLPPLPGVGVKPNVLLLVDNSASMGDLAYADSRMSCSVTTAQSCTTSADCPQGEVCRSPNLCYDDSYQDNATYAGYFERDTVYAYDFNASKFVPGAALPPPSGPDPSCGASTAYLYAWMSGPTAPRTVTALVARGNFLNWLTASKLDIEKLALTGGKYQADPGGGGTGVLVGESRGCQGKRFVKVAPKVAESDVSALTFAVTGPIPAKSPSNCSQSKATSCSSTYESLASSGGATTIEVYDAPYGKTACQAAVRDWQQAASPDKVDLASFRSDIRSCMGAQTIKIPKSVGFDPVETEAGIFADAMAYCHTNNYVMMSECAPHIFYLRNKLPNSIPRSAGDAVCGKGYAHIPSTGNSNGFVGLFYQSTPVYTITPGTPTNPNNEMQDYCTDLTRPLWSDPSVSAVNGYPVPAVLFDIGMVPLGQPVATLAVRVAVSAPPVGVVQQYGGDLNLGVMVYNDNGAASECASDLINKKYQGSGNPDIACPRHCMKGSVDSGRECFLEGDCSDLAGNSCQLLPLQDGARVLAPVASPLGDHTPPPDGSVSLVSAIDQIKAATWSPLSEALYTAIGYFGNRSDLKLQSGDFGSAPVMVPCQANHLVLATDGISTADRHPSVLTLVGQAKASWVNATDKMPSSTTTAAGDSSPPFKGSYNVDDLAWIGRHKNLADFSQPVTANRDVVTTHVVYTGTPCGAVNSDGSCISSGEGVPEVLMRQTAYNGGGKLAKAQSPSDLVGAFQSILNGIVAGSGTDPTIISTPQGNGALFLREQFTPLKSFDGGATAASWAGEMQGLWYYIDPFIGTSTGAATGIREDTDQNLKLTLSGDRTVTFNYDPNTGQTLAHLAADPNGDGIAERDDGNEEVDQLKTLWRAGELLWARDLKSSPRNIYTPLLRGGSQVDASGLMSFSPDAAAAITPYLNLGSGDPSASTVIKFVQGYDFPNDSTLRSRSVSIAGNGGSPERGSGVWKLGDIVSSTGQAETPVALAGYQLAVPAGYGDLSYGQFIATGSYQARGMVFVGANDGMLHAFRTGILDPSPTGGIQATLTGDEPGKEEWAFIPTSVLPYLKYLTHPDYRHLYQVDGRITLVDASIGETAGDCSPATYWSCPRDPSGKTWRTVLIVGMGLGGAACSTGSGCISPPANDPYSSGRMVGYSSYAALDVTDPYHPIFLWEFSDPSLGFSTTGPAILRVGDNQANGRWFAVFGSGPNGSLDASHRFLGTSTQQLTLFVVDLRTGQLLTTFPTGLVQAFAGSLAGAGIDADRWNADDGGGYQDDGLYVGYSQADTGGGWRGGVLRLFTRENQDPGQWRLSKVAEGTGPVTGGIGRIQDRKNQNLWLYFGSGRYFNNQDDLSERRTLFAIKEPCYNIKVNGVVAKANKLDGNCTDAANVGGLVDQSGAVKEVAATDPGWRIDLNAAAGGLGAERVLTAPLATRSGALFFATFQPNTDPCQNGDAYLWGVRYDTGGTIGDLSLKGTAMVQLSTGAVGTASISDLVKGRRGGKLTGIPGGVKIISNSGLRPVKRILHMKER